MGIDWSSVGAAAAGLLLGGGAWLRERKKRKESVEPWDGETERRDRPDRLTGHGMVLMIEASGAEMPRHWVRFMDERVADKMKHVIAPVASQMSNVESDVHEVKQNVEKLTRIANRLIGRLLPDEPID